MNKQAGVSGSAQSKNKHGIATQECDQWESASLYWPFVDASCSSAELLTPVTIAANG
jgi:hypothetical protein